MTDLNDSNAQNETDPNGSNDLNFCSTNRGRPSPPLGITATDDEKMAMLQGVKAKSFEKKDLLTTDEFKTIVDRVLQKTPAQAR
jgi:hypothetical protein